MDRYQRDINLARVLCEVRDNPEVLTATRYASKYRPEHRELARQEFRRVADASGERVSVRIVQRDIARLRRESKRVKRFVDTRVGHYGKWPQKKVPTFGDIHNALSVLGDTFMKYDLLIRRKGWVNLEPVPQYDLLEPFRRPWLPK